MQHRGAPRALLLSALQGQGSGVLPAQGSKQPRNLSTHKPVAVDKAGLLPQKAWLCFCSGCIANCQQKADQEQCWALPAKSAAALRRVLSWKREFSSTLPNPKPCKPYLCKRPPCLQQDSSSPQRSPARGNGSSREPHPGWGEREQRDSTELTHFAQGSRNKNETVSEPCP